MEKIAFYLGDTAVYWQNLVLTLAAAVAILFFLAFYLEKTGNSLAAFALPPLALFLSLVFSRFFHWYCRTDSYPGFLSAMKLFSPGGYALMGVFLGVFLAAAALRLLRLCPSLPEMLDCASLAGAAGIAVGRLSSLFDSSDRGQVLQNFHFLPFSYPVVNPVSGATEYRLATFLFQGAMALILFLLLARYWMRRRRALPQGDLCLIFLMGYGASQAVLDSTRYDSLFFRSNGFVSMVQVFSALALVGGIVYFSRRLVKRKGFHLFYVPLWLAMAAALGGAGFMEYYVQRHGSTALFSYSVMSLCLGLALALGLLCRSMAGISIMRTE